MAQYLPVLISPQGEYRQHRQNVELVCFDESLLRYKECHNDHCWRTVCVSNYTYTYIFSVCMRYFTFGSWAEAGAVWGESMLVGGGKVRKLASRGERTISFCLYRRWCRSLHTQASNTSGDFTYTHTQRTVTRQTTHVSSICLSGLLLTWLLQIRTMHFSLL